MKVDNFNISMASESSFELRYSNSSTTQLHYANGSGEVAQGISASTSSLDISYSQFSVTESSRMAYDYEENMSDKDRVNKKIIEKLLELFYGKEQKIESLPPSKRDEALKCDNNPYLQNSSQNSSRGSLIGIVFESSEEYYQKQSVEFSSSLELKSGNEVYKLDLSISFSKELYESHSTRLVIGDERVLDPLVINYDSDTNPFENLSSLKFEFDLDSNGESDLIPLLKEGSGFLALDKNGNGKIDNGSELFGTKSGDGFKDLAKYDGDKNGWIDESDEVFNKLKIWQKDDSGKDNLISLVDLNVGAIYLGDVDSGYKYQSSISSTDAVQKSNGVFVKEDKSGLGVVNSIDIVV